MWSSYVSRLRNRSSTSSLEVPVTGPVLRLSAGGYKVSRLREFSDSKPTGMRSQPTYLCVSSGTLRSVCRSNHKFASLSDHRYTKMLQQPSSPTTTSGGHNFASLRLCLLLPRLWAISGSYTFKKITCTYVNRMESASYPDVPTVASNMVVLSCRDICSQQSQ